MICRTAAAATAEPRLGLAPALPAGPTPPPLLLLRWSAKATRFLPGASELEGADWTLPSSSRSFSASMGLCRQDAALEKTGILAEGLWESWPPCRARRLRGKELAAVDEAR